MPSILLDGFVKPESAARDYGVVVDDKGLIDEPATRARRQSIREQRQWNEAPLYGFDPAREAYMAKWSDGLEDALIEAVSGLPVQLKQFLHQKLHDTIVARIDRGDSISIEEVPQILAEEREALNLPAEVAATGMKHVSQVSVTK